MADSILHPNSIIAERKEGERSTQSDQRAIVYQNAAFRESVGWTEVENLRQQISNETSTTFDNLSGQIPIPKVGSNFDDQNPDIPTQPISTSDLNPIYHNHQDNKLAKVTKMKLSDSAYWRAMSIARATSIRSKRLLDQRLQSFNTPNLDLAA